MSNATGLLTQSRGRSAWRRLAGVLAAVCLLAGMAGPSVEAGASVAPRADTWHRVDLLLIARTAFDGYTCNHFGTRDEACIGGLSTDKVDPPFNGGLASARWINANGGLNFGIFKSDYFISGWMPNGGSNRFTVTSGITNFSGNDNVVSGTDPGAPGQQGTPLDIKVKEINCTLGPHCGYSFFVEGWVKVVPTGAPGQPGPAPGPGLAARPMASESGSITDFFENLAKDKAKSFVMDQLGIPSSEQAVEELKAKVDQLNRNLTAIGEQLNRAITEFKFDVLALKLTDITNSLLNAYTTDMKPLAYDVVKIKQALAAHDMTAYQKALDTYNDHKRSFIADGSMFTGAVQGIHTLLQPPLPKTTPFLYALGDVIMVQQRYLTAPDSATMQAVYNYAQEYQALAAWITCEWAIASDKPTVLDDTISSFLTDAQQQRNPALNGGLPPGLPAGVVLDRGPYDGKSITSTDKTMLTYSGVYDAFWQEGASHSPYSVPNVLVAMNRRRPGGFSDWGMPTVAQLNSLVADRGSASPRSRLNTVFAPLVMSTATDFAWTSDTHSKQVPKVYGAGPDFSYPVRLGFSLSDGGSREYPGALNKTGPYNWSDEVDFTVRQPLGQVILARSSGSTRYF